MRVVLIVLISLISLYAGSLPKMAFLAYNGDSWLVCLSDSKGDVKEIKLDQEPHLFDYNFKTGEILYVGENSKVRLYSRGKARELNLSYEKSAYTQASFSCKDDVAYVVELINKNSKSTQIMQINLKDDSLSGVIKQNSSQFELVEVDANRVIYTNLICNVGCGKLIQEIWMKDRVRADSKQLTLLNSFSNNPTIKYNDKFIFFSSNKSGNYHIWVKEVDSNKVSLELTKGDVTDSFPNSLGNGSFVYISEIKNKIFIMQGAINGDFKKIKLSKEYDKIRQLKVNRCE